MCEKFVGISICHKKDERCENDGNEEERRKNALLIWKTLQF